MRRLVRNSLFVLGALAMAACSSTSPEDALNEAAERLQASLQSRQAGAVARQLHDDFLAQQHYNRQAVRQQMLGLFMRYKSVNILVVNRQCQLDTGFNYRGQCTAQVAVTGAQGLIPERLEYYRVSSEWEWVEGEWLLHRLDWE